MTARPAGAILAGGRSARLGGVHKGLLEVGGRRIIDRVAAALAPSVSSLLIVADADDAAEWLPGAVVVRDVLKGGGSAAGVHAALVAAARPVIVVAWDLPFVLSEMCAALAEAGDPALADAVVPRGEHGGVYEPLCGWYAPSCAPVISARWKRGELSLHGLLFDVRTTVIDPESTGSKDAVRRMFLNVNTADDLDRARAEAGDA